MVPGVFCANRHFVDPRVPRCMFCDDPISQTSVVLVDGPRPVLGDLVLGTGESFPVRRNIVVGREPTTDPSVQQGDADGWDLSAESLRLSRVHAAISLDGWDVRIIDRNSTNGTFVWNADDDAWDQLDPGQPRRIQHGDRIAFADITIAFERPDGA